MSFYAISYPHDRITCSAATMLNQTLDIAQVEYVAGFGNITEGIKGAVVIFHAQHELLKPAIGERLSWFVRGFDWVIFVSIGDEGGQFPYQTVEHKNMRLWVQTPKPGKVKADRYFIEGYHPNTHAELKGSENGVRDLDWFFAGQVNHSRRYELVNALATLKNTGYLLATDGFMQGMPPREYYGYMRRAKIVLCPAGPATPDSFRFVETLIAGGIPILDAYSPDRIEGYWDMVLGAHPFKIVEDWSTLPEVMAELLENYSEHQRLAQQWWAKYKSQMFTVWLDEDLKLLGAA